MKYELRVKDTNLTYIYLPATKVLPKPSMVFSQSGTDRFKSLTVIGPVSLYSDETLYLWADKNPRKL